MSERVYDQAYYQNLLYELLPAVYRARDGTQELRTLLALFGHEFSRLHGNIDQLWSDFYIDTCQPWVIPYIGDLVGTDVLFDEPERNRADVKNTIRWRRQKGTLTGLEDIAAVIGGWGALAVEMFERLVWSQNLNHLRPQAVHAVDLKNPSRLARLNTPFESSCRSVDLRSPDQRVGWHQLRNVSFFQWVIASHPRTSVDPVSTGDGRYRFHPLGLDVPLYAGGDKAAARDDGRAESAPRPDTGFAHIDDVAIRGRDFRDNPQRYFGQPAGFSLYEDGILLCGTRDPEPGHSTQPLAEFSELAAAGGIRVADESLFGSGADFRIDALRLNSPQSYSPVKAFEDNFEVQEVHASIETTGFSYAHHHLETTSHPGTLLRIERLGADANFPECEIILRSARGRHLLVFLPALTVPAGVSVPLYLADDGSTYFARATHDGGEINLNPDAGPLGGFLPKHLARAALGQIRPRPGIRPVAHRTAVHRALCCWDQPLPVPLEPGEVAFDPQRGRFLFAPGAEPAGELTVSFRCAITGQIGAGPYFRGRLPDATHSVAQERNADHTTIQAAIDAAPEGRADPVVIEVRDSRTYNEALTINSRHFPGGLIIQAAPLATPLLRSPGGDVLTVADSSAGKLTLDGFVIGGGNLVIGGDVPDLELRYCSVQPQTASLSFLPDAAGARLGVSHAITGPIHLSTAVTRAAVSDSVVQNPFASVEHPEGHMALEAAHAVDLERVTVLGEVEAGVLMASNTILHGPINVASPDQSCVRYSRLPGIAPPVRTFETTSRFPVFLSTTFPDPGYMHLHPNSAAALLRGGEAAGEMGAFYGAQIPWREQSVMIKLSDNLPAGLEPIGVRVLPSTRFRGEVRK